MNEQIAAKREAARRARRLAWYFQRPEDRERALAFAAELETQADALEEEAAKALSTKRKEQEEFDGAGA